MALRPKLSFAVRELERRQRLLLFCCLCLSPHGSLRSETPFLQAASTILAKASDPSVLPAGAGLPRVLLLNLVSLDVAEFVSSAPWFVPSG